MSEIEKVKLQMQAQQDNFEKMFTSIVEQMHEALVRNGEILEGKLLELDAIPDIQIEDDIDIEDTEVFYIGQTLKINGFELSIAVITENTLLCKTIISTGSDTQVQNVQVPRELALQALDTLQTELDAKDEASQDVA